MFTITREIGIDAGHRVTNHGSKCKNLHGHRYTIHATVTGPLSQAGESEGMTLDFGFLKEIMLKCIDEPCDHALILWWDDPLLPILMPLDLADFDRTRPLSVMGSCGRVYLVPFVPTAENLAWHWFELLRPEVLTCTNGRAKILKLRVDETPNCWAEYSQEESSINE